MAKKLILRRNGSCHLYCNENFKDAKVVYEGDVHFHPCCYLVKWYVLKK